VSKSFVKSCGMPSAALSRQAIDWGLTGNELMDAFARFVIVASGHSGWSYRDTSAVHHGPQP
jgi:hypothetical protein